MKFFDALFEVKDMTDSGAFAGMGSVYGNVDDGGDIVAPGAFTQSLTELGAKQRMPAMLWQHRAGSPIGAYTKMTDSESGLYVEGKLAMKTQLGAEAYELMKMKAISGLSIGFLTRDDSYDQKNGVRTIKQADLWEVSLVTFPMNDQARVSAVKSIEEIGDLNGAESYLREVGGVSRSEAKALVSRLLSIARREVGRSEDSGELKAIATLFDKRRSLMT